MILCMTNLSISHSIPQSYPTHVQKAANHQCIQSDQHQFKQLIEESSYLMQNFRATVLCFPVYMGHQIQYYVRANV